MSAAFPDQSQASGDSFAGRRLGLSLMVVATAQLMLVLDDSIANIALPSIQADLGVSAANLPWVINAYVLVFGALLLFGGRVGDLFGRRRVLRIGLVVFVAASLLGGLAPNTGLLIAARALQGLGAALAAPNALALIATTFPTGKPRNSAMAVYGAMSAVGIVAGVLLGGFRALQARTDLPLLPLGLFADRNRAGSYATILFIGAGLMGSFYLLALFLQQVLQFGPLKTGVASLPFAAGII